MSFKTSRPNKTQADKLAHEFRQDLNNPRNRVKVYPEIESSIFDNQVITEWIIEVD